MQTFVYEPFWYNYADNGPSDRIDFSCRCAVAGEWFGVAIFSMQYGVWEGPATTGQFFRRVESGLVEPNDRKNNPWYWNTSVELINTLSKKEV